MDRREFLRLLGFGAANAFIPFSIIPKEKIPEEPIGFESIKRVIEAIETASNKYQIIIIDDKGNHLWAPPTKYFIKEETKVTFFAENIAIDKSCIIVSAKLLSPDGRVMGMHTLVSPIYANDGDFLNLNYCVSAS